MSTIGSRHKSQLALEIWNLEIPLRIKLVPSSLSPRPPTQPASPREAALRCSEPLLQHSPTIGEPTPYYLRVPRFSFLSQLLPRVRAYFGIDATATARFRGFRHDGVMLRTESMWVGLLADLYRPAEMPWTLEAVWDGVTEAKVEGKGRPANAAEPQPGKNKSTPLDFVPVGPPSSGVNTGHPAGGMAWARLTMDAFLNAAKEADYVRNGHSRNIMKMGVNDTTGMWNAVLENDYEAFHSITSKLLNPPTPIKHAPIRLFVPRVPGPASGDDSTSSVTSAFGSFRVVQSLIPILFSNLEGSHARQALLGDAMCRIAPGLFATSRGSSVTQVVMHGAMVPWEAPLEELMHEAAYPDGWLNLVVVLK